MKTSFLSGNKTFRQCFIPLVIFKHCGIFECVDKFPIHIKYARDLRQRQTPEEKIMWSKLRNRKLLGYKFLRQYPIVLEERFFIADFYCDEKKLVVEIDGGIHEFRKEYDEHRDEVMNALGLTVLRIKNEEVNEDVYAVLKKIKGFLVAM